MKKAIKITIIVAIVAVVVVGAVLGGVFGTISASANSSKAITTREQAEKVARDFLSTTKYGADDYYLTDYDRDIENDGNISESFYVYEFEFDCPTWHDDISVHVNAKTGEASFYNVYDRD